MKRSVKILVVEDSEDDARLAIRMLRRGGMDPVYQRVQDVDALRAALTGESWDAVLSDFRMPGFTGVEALDVLRSSGLDIPFIFISGTIGEEVAVAAMKAGASDYVMKQNLTRLAPVLERELAQAEIRAEHRQVQKDLEASYDRFVDLYDFAPVGYLTLSAEGRIEQVNLTAAEMLQTPREQVLRQYFDHFVHGTDRERWNEQLRQALEEGKRLRFELTLSGGSGSGMEVQLDCMRVTGPDAAVLIRIALTDISDRRDAEKHARDIEAQLRAAQKMESLGTLAGGIAHDFNNILAAILGNVALLRDELAEGRPGRDCLEEINDASLRARNLVQQILMFSRREPQELVPQPLQGIIEDTHRLLRATLPAAVDLSVVLCAPPLIVHANATQIQQALMNLCTNAWHSLAQGVGSIEVGLEPVTLDAEGAQRVGSVTIGPFVHLWVRDTGTGMDAATRERIFEPFFTTKPVGHGTGLGLSVVHGIVTAHSGTIAVESEPGKGTTFHLYLPRTQSPAPTAATEPATIEAPRGEGRHVLFVDDDATILLVIQRLLVRAGYRVSAFQDVRQAIDLIRASRDALDVVVTDYNMPDVSGLEFARMVAAIDPTLPVVISSGYITEEMKFEARRVGVRAFLQKENAVQELQPLLATVLAEASASRRGVRRNDAGPR